MIRSLRGATAVALLGSASLFLTACGGSSDPAADATASATSATSSAPSTAGTEQAPVVPGDGTLTIGSLLPQTGSLAFLGPPEFAGVQLAINEINEAGGYNNKDVVYSETDSGDTTTNIASQSVDRLLAANTDAIIGAASSGVSKTVIDAITGAGVIQVSPANTSPDFTTYADRGLYWRTAPSDVLQGRVMGDLLVNDNHLDVATITLDDPYGSGLQTNIQQALEAGGGQIVQNSVFNPDAATFDSIASDVAAKNPEAIVVIGFEQTVQIIQALVTQNIGPANVPIYFVDGNLSNYGDDFPAGTLKGVKGTLPGAATTGDFRDRLLALNPQLADFSYAPEAYDATVLVALAAQAAKNDSGTGIASMMQSVSEGGTKCTAYKECLDLLNAGTDIDYDGYSGPIEFNAQGDETQATIGIYEYGDDNTYTNIDYVTGSI